MKFFFCAFFATNFADIVLSAEWSYKENDGTLFGPSQWGRVNPACDGRRQSPINFETAVPVHTFHPVKIQNVFSMPNSTTVRNDGHGFAMSLNFNDGTRHSISGGPLGYDTYYLHDFHLHWGSEHTLNGKVFDAELHLVHFNAKYRDITTAFNHADGLAVLGVFLELDQSTDMVRPIVKSAMKVREFGSPKVTETAPESLFTIYDLVQRKKFKVWNYLGSLTVPQCNEIVEWMVSRDTAPIYKSELQLLRTMQSDHGDLVVANRRPTQPLNGRIVRQY